MRAMVHPQISDVEEKLAAPSNFALHYQTTPSWPFSVGSSKSEVNIAVLDSSFNPPTIAHLAMASTPAPPHISYDARLLLYAVTNADKGSSIKPGHASPEQRFQLMGLTADTVSASLSQKESGVAVATTTLPYFADKSREIVRALSDKRDGKPRIRLWWLVGWDTIVRIFDPKYYREKGVSNDNALMRKALDPFLGEQQDGSRIVAFRRPGSSSSDMSTRDAAAEKEFLEREVVREFMELGVIYLMDLKEEAVGVSSTDVRSAVKESKMDCLERMVDKEVLEYIKANNLYSQN